MKRKNLLLSFICSMAVVLSLGGLTGCFGGNKSDDSSSVASSADVSDSSSEEVGESSSEDVSQSSEDGEESSSASSEVSSEASSETSSEENSSSEEEEGTVIYENVPMSFSLKLSEITDEQKTAAYYLNGVTVTKDGETLSVDADLSAVDFTAAGEYTITYFVDGEDKTATCGVMIFDTPVITAEDEISIDWNWFVASSEMIIAEEVNKVVSVKDSLGVDMTVSISGLEKNAYGFYGAGAYAVTLTATDVVGNVATKEISLTLTQGTAPSIENVNIDLSNIAVALTDYEVFVDFDLYAVGEDGVTPLTNKEVKYDVSIGGTVFTAEYVASLAGAGEKEFIVVLSNAYTTVSATVTDDQAPAFSYSEASSFAYITGEEFALPQATKNLNSVQAIDVKYTLDGAEYTGNPTAAGEYTYAIEFYRGEDKVLTKEYKIVLVDNYGWSANSVKATENGNIAITGKTGDVNAVLSADYIAAQGTYNTIVLKANVLQESSNQADTNEATGPSFWWIDGNTYALEEKETYYGLSKDYVKEGAEVTLTLRVEADVSATFILRNFDGWLEITDMEFLYLDAKLAAQQKLNATFPGWDYVHHNDPNAYVIDQTYYIGGGNFTLTNLLVSDAMAAGYKYVTIRIKMMNASTPIEELYFTTLASGYSWDHYWQSYTGNEAVVRLDLSKYFDSTDLANSGNNILQFKGRYIGGNDISADAIEIELIGFETEDVADCFVSVPLGGNYTVTGAMYAKAVDGSATFAISAMENYAISSVTASGDAVVTDNGDGTYTVNNITRDTYLSVATRKTMYAVTLAESENYTADKYSATVKEGESCTFTISVNEGFEIESVTADNATVADNGDGTYTISNATADTVITVSTKAAKSSYIITLAAGENYTASFAQTEVEKDSEYSFSVTANEGYEISSVTADNATVADNGDGTYTIS
ncbi:MAG: hypothetical protein IJX09_03750, partial [Clostridia bacterium]|nr:hypothetical protein [Clostridia bacterium]